MRDFERNGHFPKRGQRAALVVAHPGHELKVHGWLETARPLVFVLTDGSGHSNQPRLSSTTAILNRVQAEPGSLFGCVTDRAAYAAILNHDFDLFLDLAGKLSETFVSERIEVVVGDALEGYNPMHDVCRLIVNAAVRAASKGKGHEIANLAFSLVDHPHPDLESSPANEVCLELDDEALERKISAAQGYAELANEVSKALEKTAIDAFRVERLRHFNPDECAGYSIENPPFYEQYGVKQVAAGHYEQVLRYSEHIAPLAEALSAWSNTKPAFVPSPVGKGNNIPGSY
jgi:hypothetical protein